MRNSDNENKWEFIRLYKLSHMLRIQAVTFNMITKNVNQKFTNSLIILKFSYNYKMMLKSISCECFIAS